MGYYQRDDDDPFGLYGNGNGNGNGNGASGGSGAYGGGSNSQRPSGSGYSTPSPQYPQNMPHNVAPENPRGPLAERMNASNNYPGSFTSSGAMQRYGGSDGTGSLQRGAPLSSQENNFYDLKTRVQRALVAELDSRVDLSQTDKVRKQIAELFNRVLTQEEIVLSRAQREQLLEAISAEILGFGPIEPLLNDENVTEIMVNGPRNVYFEKDGLIQHSEIRFRDDDHVRRVIDRIISPLGRHCDEAQPYVDARLPDGSRVNAIIPPLSLIGPVLTIRKFSRTPLQPIDLIRMGAISQPMMDFLRACVQVRLNIIVSGGTSTGKTTFLNVLSSFIPNDQRIISIEESAELQLRQENWVPLEGRPANIEGKGEVSIRKLVSNALRMRPDRIIVGECRGPEALDMLQAMNSGHEGSLTTLHSNSPRDTLRRLETMAMMATMDLPLRAIREQIASAVHLIVHQGRMRDGSRKITHISEVVGLEGEVFNVQDLFVFDQTGFHDGRVVGTLRSTGVRPAFMDLFELADIHLPPLMFDKRG